MSKRFQNLYRVLCLMVAAQAAHATTAKEGVAPRVQPSDCRARDADSTCAAAVAGAPTPAVPPFIQDPVLYDGPLGGVPPAGYWYWGYDFFADENGYPSLVRQDEFINRSKAPVTITLSFNFPTDHPCNKACLPGVEFRVGPGWSKVDPAYVVSGNNVSLTQTFSPGRGFGWVIGLWEATNPRLTVTIPKGAFATLSDVGMSTAPNIASEIAAVNGTCECADGTIAACSDGSRFSNGLLGSWYQEGSVYTRAGAFNNCPPNR